MPIQTEVATTDTAELRKLQEETSKLKAERDELVMATKLRNHAANPAHDFVDPEMVASITRKDVVLGQDDCLYTKDGRPVDQLLSDFKNSHEFMTNAHFRARSSSMQGGDPKASFSGNLDYPVERLFGKDSDAGLANKLAMRDPKEYRRLKEFAKRKGLIG